MAGYSGTPLWKKLGYKDGLVACCEGAPQGYLAALALPSDVSVKWVQRVGAGTQFVHLFSISKSALASRLSALRKTIQPDGAIWVSWPKKSSGVQTDITENGIREVALPLGLVDVKVCAVDETWSGLKLVVRKKLR